jgi:FkbM family methyltransferase
MNRKIFIDCGANMGQSIDHFNTMYSDSDEYEIYSFEGNLKLTVEIEKKYKNLVSGGKLKIYNKVVWIHDGKLKFYISSGDTLGSSTNNHKWNVRDDNFEMVESINLSKWIKTNFDKNDIIVLKMDIEGGEYEVIPHMLKTGVIDYINKFYFEGHYHKMKGNKEQNRLKKIHEYIQNEFKNKYPNVLEERWTAVGGG